MSEEDDLEGLDDINSEDLEGLEDEEDLEDEDIEKLEREIALLETEGGVNLSVEELEQLEEEVEERDLEESGNMFIGAFLRPKYSLLMDLEEEIAKEEELDKTRPRGSVPKYLVNPFALKNRIDYEEIFESIDPEEPTLRIWKMDDFEPRPIPTNEYGKFYSGDAYIVLYITEYIEGGIVINIHHWIGQEATTDKFGAAAYRAVELNMYLGGRCNIYRELEAEESQLFVDYFNNSIEYLVGGTAVCFNHVEPNRMEYKPNMYQILPQSGSTHIMKLVELNWNSLDSEYCYLLDSGKRIYQWNGKFTNKLARSIAYSCALDIRSNDRKGSAEIIPINEGIIEEQYLYEYELFWGYLKGRKPVPSDDEKPSPPEIEKRFLYYEDDDEEEEEDEEDDEEDDEEQENKKSKKQGQPPSAPILSVNVIGSWDNFKNPISMDNVDGDWDLHVSLRDGEYFYQYQVTTTEGVKLCCDKVRPQKHMEGRGMVNIVQAVTTPDEVFTFYGIFPRKNGGQPQLKEVDYENNLTSSLLDSRYSYILDCGTELFVWVGKKSDVKTGRKVAVGVGEKLFTKFERPKFSLIYNLREQGENTTFIRKFRQWTYRKSEDYQMEGKGKKKNANKKKKSVKFALSSIVNVEALLRDVDKSNAEPITCKGTVEVRLFTAYDGASSGPVPDKQIGIFFSSSCYVILNKYDFVTSRKKTIQKFLLYFWTGVSCHNADMVYAKFNLEFLKLLLNRVGPDRLQCVRVYQGKEPEHFMRLFNGRVIIKQGDHQLYSRYLSQSCLYDITFTPYSDQFTSVNIYEVDKHANSLISTRCFILHSYDTECKKYKTFVWCGKFTGDVEKTLSGGVIRWLSKSGLHGLCNSNNQEIIHIQQNDPTNLDDNHELFYSLLSGGADLYEKNQITYAQFNPVGRLYQMTYVNAIFEVSEIQNFVQFDLLLHLSSAFLLQTRAIVYLWFGKEATDYLKKQARLAATEWVNQVKYLKEQKIMQGGDGESSGNSSIPLQSIVELNQGEECNEFKFYFPSWNENVNKFEDKVKIERQYREGYSREFYSLESRVERVYDRVQDKAELLETIASSCEYSSAEEKAANPLFDVVKPSFDKELILLGLKEAPAEKEVNKFEEFKSNIKDGEILFHKKSSTAFTVLLSGSWDNFQATPMVRITNEDFVFKLTLDAGYYYYYYAVATSDGIQYAFDDNQIFIDCSTTVNELTSKHLKEKDDERLTGFNLIWVYLVTHPTYIEQQKLLQQQEEEQRKKAEEDSKKVVTAADLIKHEQMIKEQQRIANEERLKRQLEERRKNRTNVTADVTLSTSSIEDKLDDIESFLSSSSYRKRKPLGELGKQKSILDDVSELTSSRKSTASTKSSEEDVITSGRYRRNADSAKSVVDSIASAPKRVEDSSSTPASTSKLSYREQRLLELGLGKPSSESAPAPSTSTRTSRYTSRFSTDSAADSPSSTDSTTTRTSRYTSRYSTDTSDSAPSDSTTTSTRTSRYSSTTDRDDTPASTRASRYSSLSTDKDDTPSTSTTSTRTSRYSSLSTDKDDTPSTTSTRSSRYSSLSADLDTPSTSTSTRTSRYSSLSTPDKDDTPPSTTTRASRYSSVSDTTDTTSTTKDTSTLSRREKRLLELGLLNTGSSSTSESVPTTSTSSDSSSTRSSRYSRTTDTTADEPSTTSSRYTSRYSSDSTTDTPTTTSTTRTSRYSSTSEPADSTTSSTRTSRYSSTSEPDTTSSASTTRTSRYSSTSAAEPDSTTSTRSSRYSSTATDTPSTSTTSSTRTSRYSSLSTDSDTTPSTSTSATRASRYTSTTADSSDTTSSARTSRFTSGTDSPTRLRKETTDTAGSAAGNDAEERERKRRERRKALGLE